MAADTGKRKRRSFIKAITKPKAAKNAAAIALRNVDTCPARQTAVTGPCCATTKACYTKGMPNVIVEAHVDDHTANNNDASLGLFLQSIRNTSARNQDNHPMTKLLSAARKGKRFKRKGGTE